MDGVNQFAYSRGSPVRHFDPSGTRTEDPTITAPRETSRLEEAIGGHVVDKEGPAAFLKTGVRLENDTELRPEHVRKAAAMIIAAEQLDQAEYDEERSDAEAAVNTADTARKTAKTEKKGLSVRWERWKDFRAAKKAFRLKVKEASFRGENVEWSVQFFQDRESGRIGMTMPLPGERRTKAGASAAFLWDSQGLEAAFGRKAGMLPGVHSVGGIHSHPRASKVEQGPTYSAPEIWLRPRSKGRRNTCLPRIGSF